MTERARRGREQAPCADCGHRTIGTPKHPGEWYMVRDLAGRGHAADA